MLLQEETKNYESNKNYLKGRYYYEVYKFNRNYVFQLRFYISNKRYTLWLEVAAPGVTLFKGLLLL